MTMSSALPEDSVTIKATISILPDNPAFDGHFSGFPVYPGVAQIQNVCDLLSEHFGSKVNLTQISRTKFLSLVAPSSVLEVSCLVNRAWSEFPDSTLLVAEKCSFTESKLRFSSSSRLDSENPEQALKTRQVSWTITRISGPCGTQIPDVVCKGRGVFSFQNDQSQG